MAEGDLNVRFIHKPAVIDQKTGEIIVPETSWFEFWTCVLGEDGWWRVLSWKTPPDRFRQSIIGGFPIPSEDPAKFDFRKVKQ